MVVEGKGGQVRRGGGCGWFGREMGDGERSCVVGDCASLFRIGPGVFEVLDPYDRFPGVGMLPRHEPHIRYWSAEKGGTGLGPDSRTAVNHQA